ncbi:MAG: hypothetical protein JO165_11285 [Candidatus Eremiobacteraeota bacterium]|nr:hypothetical protein [Candidatus Eremiobacteraeota bacterium]
MRLTSPVITLAIVLAIGSGAAAQSPSPSPAPSAPATVVPATVAPSPTAQPSAAPTPTPQPTPQDTARISAPSGWRPGSTAQSGPFIILHLWRPPAKLIRADNVVLGFVPLGNAQGANTPTYGKAVADAVRKMGPPHNVKQSKPITICRGTQQGWFIEDVLNFGSLKVRQESVLAAGPHEGFMAAYTRKDGDRPISAAESSIRTLCVK